MKRMLWSVALLLAGYGNVHAQTVNLAEGPLTKTCFRNELSMDMTGRITMQQDGKTVALRQNAFARHEYLERILEAKDGVGDKAVRIYQAAGATITVGNDASKLAFSPEHLLMVSHRQHNQIQTYCPSGLLTNEEMELTEHFDTLALAGLLSGKDVAVGATWVVPANVVLAVCEVDAIISGQLNAKLTSVQGSVAEVTITGIIKGISSGAQVVMEINGRLAFATTEKRIIAAEWKQHDERTQGPISPAMTADVAYKIKRTPIAEPNELNDIALVRPLSAAADKMTNVTYRDPKGAFAFQHGRNWHLVGRDDKHLVYRLLTDRGDFVAQATLMPYTKETPGKMMDLDNFARRMAEVPGWTQEEVLEKNANLGVSEDLKVYRVGAAGKLSGVPAVQYFHLMTGPRGDQLIVTFTMDPSQTSNLSQHDMAFLRGVSFP
jgi:hypothetical protein